MRMAPLYDAVTTRVFARLERDRMALKLNSKDDRLNRADFRTLASTIGLRAGDADLAIDDMIDRMKQAADEVALPKLSDYGPEGDAMAARMLDICRMRIKLFT
ncbi:hypothetical protein ACVBEF_12140 [Glaciimonas sp. GG7]